VTKSRRAYRHPASSESESPSTLQGASRDRIDLAPEIFTNDQRTLVVVQGRQVEEIETAAPAAERQAQS
jgi:hypothetical protein